MIDPAVFPKVPDLYTQFSKSNVTDLIPAQIVSLSCVAKGTTFSKILTFEVTKEMVTIKVDAVVLKDLAATKKAMRDLLQ
jgi:hypothetical protein